MKDKNKYKVKNFNCLKTNHIDVVKSKAGDWRKSSNSDTWYRPLFDYFIKCERMTMCAYIEKEGGEYSGTCVGLEEIIKSPSLGALMCTLDIILLNSNLELKNYLDGVYSEEPK